MKMWHFEVEIDYKNVWIILEFGVLVQVLYILWVLIVNFIWIETNIWTFQID